MFQLLFLIGWIGIFILSALGIIKVFIPEEISTYIAFIKGKYIFYGYSLDIDRVWISIYVFYLFVSIKKFLSMFKGNENRTFTFESERGLISISYSSIESIVKKVLTEESYILSKKVRIKEKKKKILINIKADCEDLEGITEKLALLQNKIDAELEKITSIKTYKVNIKVAKIISKEDEIISTEGE